MEPKSLNVLVMCLLVVFPHTHKGPGSKIQTHDPLAVSANHQRQTQS